MMPRIDPADLASTPTPPPLITTNIPALDEILGGGMPQGRVVSLSTTLDMKAEIPALLAKQIAKHRNTVYLTASSTISPDQFIQLVKDIVKAIETPDTDMIIVDGLEDATLEPRPTPIAVLGQYLISYLPELAERCKKHNVTLVFTARTSLLITRYWAALRLHVSTSQDGNYVSVVVVKNMAAATQDWCVDLPLSAFETLT